MSHDRLQSTFTRQVKQTEKVLVVMNYPEIQPSWNLTFILISEETNTFYTSTQTSPCYYFTLLFPIEHCCCTSRKLLGSIRCAANTERACHRLCLSIPSFSFLKQTVTASTLWTTPWASLTRPSYCLLKDFKSSLGGWTR